MLGAGMSEQQPMESKPTAPPRSSGGGRRRGRRGGRGRSRGSRSTAPAAPVGEIAASVPATPVSGQTKQTESPAKQIEPPIRLHEMPVRPVLSKQKTQRPVPAAVPVARAAKPDGSAVSKAAGEVRQIVESLEQALEQMVEVLRLVELAEHQKFADEHELESLRRALHKLQPPHRERREHGG